MGLEEEIRGEFAHLGASVEVTEGEVEQVERELAAADPARVGSLLTGLGYAADEKRRGAVAIAVAQKVANLFAFAVIGA